MCKTRHILGESFSEATPTPEDSGMSFIEQSGIPRENLASVEPDSSVEICPSGNSQEFILSSCGGGWSGEFFDRRDYILF